MWLTSMMSYFLLLLKGSFGLGPILDAKEDYDGKVGENGGIVNTSPEIRVKQGPICGFRILNRDSENIPFEIFLKSPENGTAELKTRHPLDCEVQETYLLSIAAVACNGQISTS